ncbi:MAG: sulfite exporter TauE/SafE family protein [Clostridia bacterium]|nr:sulfite exporter TauE/SafE family protein [Clostridia bacterium]
MKRKGIFLLSLIGLISGIISGFLGSGGGMILVPIFTYFLKLDEVKARASTIFCITFMVITSSIFYINKDYIDVSLGIKCAIGGIIGGFIGSKLLISLKNKYLEILFIIFLIYSGIKMIL